MCVSRQLRIFLFIPLVYCISSGRGVVSIGMRYPRVHNSSIVYLRLLGSKLFSS